MSDRLLTRQEAADRLGMSTVTLWRMVRDGRLKVCKIGRMVRILESDLQMYMDGIVRVGHPETKA